MKLLVSADWHIKLGQKNVPRDWQLNRYEMLFNKLHELESQCDINLILGDIFDTVPKPEEVVLFLNYVSGCTIPTYIIDGNHCATKKGHTFLTFFKEPVKRLNKLVHIIDGIEEHHNIDFIPYTHLKAFNPKDFHNKILCTHVRGSIPPHVIPEIDLSLLSRWDVVLAGDLHSYENSQNNILYPGSPLTISFHRNKTKNGVIIFDTDTFKHTFIDLDLPSLIRKTVDKEEDIVKGTYDHVIYEVTGNILQLANIDSSSELIDKKIINSSSEAKLNLHNLSIEEELKLYLDTILQLDDMDILDTLRIFGDFYKEFEVE